MGELGNDSRTGVKEFLFWGRTSPESMFFSLTCTTVTPPFNDYIIINMNQSEWLATSAGRLEAHRIRTTHLFQAFIIVLHTHMRPNQLSTLRFAIAYSGMP